MAGFRNKVNLNLFVNISLLVQDEQKKIKSIQILSSGFYLFIYLFSLEKWQQWENIQQGYIK